MKRILLLLLIVIAIAMLPQKKLLAQSPPQMNYQAVVRNASGQIVVTSPVSLRFTIHNDSATGATVYIETIHTNTNAFGLANVQIGSTANLGTVSWSQGSKFLEVEADVNNQGFVNMGTSQLISVPYALFAANSAPGPMGPTGAQGLPGGPGPQGNAGPTGLQGATGNAGPQGQQGVIGATGNNGATGTTGATGLQGPVGNDGSAGVQGVTGAQGLPGNAGATGPQGNAGNTGLQGATGNDGATGPQGGAGPTGVTGAAGSSGSNGATGLTGATGATGANGATGAAGLGVTGPTGVNGTGATGPTGPTGSGGTPTYTVGATYYASGSQLFVGPNASNPGAGTSSSFTVPTGVTVVKVYLVGGGGGGGNNSGSGLSSSGSCGGICIGVIDVTAGETLTVFTGAAGTGYNSGTNAGKGGTGSYILRGSTLLAGAGGGGGGSSDGSTSGIAGGIGFGSTYPSNGGNGGSSTGGNGGNNYFGAMRETQAYKGYDDVSQINNGPGMFSSTFTAFYNTSVVYGYGGYYGSGDKGAVFIIW